ncbi:MAG: DUF1109 domain-containing protein [Rubrivivax sp.]|nr:DUF1109 domain-containing protein [Rubrivivax sp.]
MKTDELIDLLALAAGPAPRAVAARRLVPAALAGLAASAVVATAVMGLAAPALLHTAAPWMKLVYAGALALAAGWLTSRLARPVARLALPGSLTAAVFATMLAFGSAALTATPEGERAAALLGHSWRTCPWSVFALALPALAAALWAVRGLAPVRARAAGFAAGLFAGAVGALGYSLSCPEVSPAFVALWYSLGIALTALLGSWLGPRVLRW